MRPSSNRQIAVQAQSAAASGQDLPYISRYAGALTNYPFISDTWQNSPLAHSLLLKLMDMSLVTK
jgi:hypothetical protein